MLLRSLLLTAIVRAAQLMPTALMSSILVFSLVYMIPGDPALAIAGENASAEQIARLRETLGLNDGFIERYFSWLAGVLQGDLGTSIRSSSIAVSDLLAQRMPVTLQVVFGAMLTAVLVGVPLGVLAALRQGSRIDSALTAVSTLGVAAPDFWIGMMLIQLFAIELGALPGSGLVLVGDDPIRGLIGTLLPAIALGAVGASEIARQLRGAMVEVLSSDFVRTHRAKGLPERTIVWRRALRNASVPLVTVSGLLSARFLGAAVSVEVVFGITGVGRLIIDSVSQRDYPVIQGLALVIAMFVLVINLLTDLAYRVIDPRLRA